MCQFENLIMKDREIHSIFSHYQIFKLKYFQIIIMGILERKERDKLEMRLMILEAAKEVFVSEGFEKASIRAIAERIEYSPATIYLYFKDKNDLLFEIYSTFRKAQKVAESEDNFHKMTPGDITDIEKLI